VAEFFDRTTDEQRRALIGAFVDLLLATHTGLSAEIGESADQRRPLGAGVQSQQHEAGVSRPRDSAGFEEVSHRDLLTSTDA
jgi:hypothetical protein